MAHSQAPSKSPLLEDMNEQLLHFAAELREACADLDAVADETCEMHTKEKLVAIAGRLRGLGMKEDMAY